MLKVLGGVCLVAALIGGVLIIGGYAKVSGQVQPTPKAEQAMNQAKEQANTTAQEARKAASEALDSLSKKVK